MAENTKIEWTDATFNPWVGCTKISPACDHCYAESWAKRTGGAALWQGQRRRTTASNWRLPLKWNAEAERTGRRLRVFCASLADVFDNQVPEEWRRDLFDLIRVTPHLDWQLLTKRPQNISKMMPSDWGGGWPNVWLGTTVANQEEADRNIPHLLRVPAAKRFLSCEPLLGPITLDDIPWLADRPTFPETDDISDGRSALHRIEGSMIDWVIVGGESGGDARAMQAGWARDVQAQCQAAGVSFFFKQWGEWAPQPDGHMRRVGKKASGALLDGREWREMPA